LCWEHGVPVNYFSENGYFVGLGGGVQHERDVAARKYGAADNPQAAASIARQCVAGKLQNSRQSLLRSVMETDSPEEEKELRSAATEIARVLQRLQEFSLVTGVEVKSVGESGQPGDVDRIRGFEGQGANLYFKVFPFHLRRHRDDFPFPRRSRRPALDAMKLPAVVSIRAGCATTVSPL
jgi:CRISPR-associated protein Cas1